MDTTRALPFVSPYLFAFWGVFIWAYVLEAIQHKRSEQRAAKHGGVDRYSGLVISIGSLVLQLLGFAVSFYAPWQIPAEALVPTFWIGLALVVAGMLIRMHCWRVLGEFFTSTVTIASEHKVVDTGAYRWLRHPSYFGAFLTFIGLGLTLGNYFCIASLVLGPLALYIYRIDVEEVALEAALGQAYTEFKKTRKRFIPFVY